MAGLKWIRLETTLFENPKLLYLQEDKQYRTIVSYLQGMCYSGRHGLAGFVPKAALRVIGATQSDATRLVREGLWNPAPGGWQINGWDEYQLSNEEAVRRSEKAKKAAAARWAQRNGRQFDDLSI
ncbi:hypothetical protein SEA_DEMSCULPINBOYZ_84 [Mycobacterium phage Demsculpinboyz]|uniref:Helix-turn-helix DNA binding domain protein n=1 Tax=Mycobacterium phage Demsculpinboyz TaxID=2041528 RepID=A0A2D1GA46_9CAUD|nr:replication initiation protein [Mycobacterium phage Demsculpinboyz]ATN88679.1 hypothetical protein SEA_DEMSCULPINBOYZ_84 [Mycobacterium phage Demsculpinboyz]